MPHSNDSGFHEPMDLVDSPSIKIEPAVDEYEQYPINKRLDVGFSDQELVMQSTKALNKMIKKRGITKDRAKQIKQERRTLKNRGYAANCRVKRENEEKKLERENAELRERINRKKRQIHDDIREIEHLDKKIKVAEQEIQEYRNLLRTQFPGE